MIVHNRTRFRIWIIGLIIIISMNLGSIVMAAEENTASQPLFELKATEGADGVRVVVSARQLVDMYAYDLIVTYDPDVLKLKDAENKNNGFAVEPQIDGNQIRYAFTQIGSRSGMNGAATLVTFNMDRIGDGEAGFTLDSVKLVKSDLTMETYNPKTHMTLKADSALFTDIAGHWAESLIREAVEQGFISGYTDGSFQPERKVTRAEFVTMLTRALKAEPRSDVKLGFTDITQIPAWSVPYLQSALGKKWISGYDDNTFQANRFITRTDMTVMLVRASGLTITGEGESTFADAGQIPSYGLPYVNTAVQEGILRGRDVNKFAPGEYTTRAEAVVAILNLLKFSM